ncbi:MAG: transcriptional repressor [Acidobacteria bacterium]|nr:transcriptional repressor [Acidobacteriota bacterium]
MAESAHSSGTLSGTEPSMRSELKVFHAQLAKQGLRRTSQRDLILEVFLKCKGHLCVDEVTRLVKQEDPSVGQATIYRTLKLLSACGLAREITFDDGRTRFERQYRRANHDHLICTRCGKSVEFISRELEELQKVLAKTGKRNRDRTPLVRIRVLGKRSMKELRSYLSKKQARAK